MNVSHPYFVRQNTDEPNLDWKSRRFMVLIWQSY